ncbi:SMI1/KNR4 family protein [Shimazuella sp. AN120528]|uniref:SMI1/KNR4 family protein n=1 Tax=Shimazuella soli TaxID=1892854 RepID=UPI001F11449E|nr:SMI1/KNR4 family protein [Shimazuella soli]MCH5583519.1 SMI1/KNR4 family protein [Shimazuella soli]
MKNFFREFWDESDYYTNPIPVSDEMIDHAQQKLGYKLPQSYIALIKTKNGGIPINTCFPTNTPTSWAEDHIEIENIRGIGGDYGIDSEQTRGDAELGYPVEIGFIICDCPSAGHDAIMLDYSLCGKEGEPRVIHVDVEISDDPIITILADNFETFIKGLVNGEKYNDEEEAW